MLVAPNRDRFAVLPPERALVWKNFLRWEGRVFFPNVLGLVLEEIRDGYARVRLPFRPELNQPGGIVHGGAITGLIDTVVVPAIGSAYTEVPGMLTVDMHVQFFAAVMEKDAIAEGWVEKRGRSIAFCRVEVRDDAAELAAVGSLVYRVRPPGAAGA